MPNDPRIKFKKKIHDMSHNIIHFAGSGGGRGSRSIFEDGTPPPDPGTRPEPGGGGETGGGGVTPRDIPIIPQPLKPGLNPGEITGITIGALAGLGTLEVARRAYLEYLEEEKRKRGMQPVSQSDRPIKARRGGNILERTRGGVSRGISRGINNAAQSFEMTSTRPTRPTGPIQAEFAPLSGASTPSSYDSARSGSSTPDLQSARSRSASGASTPSSGELTSFRPGARGFQQQPSALAPASAPVPAPPKRPNRPLNLQQEIEMRQLEIRMPTTSGGRIKTLQNEINILEEQIRASGTPYTSLEERIRLAMDTPITLKRDAEQSASRILNMALEERAAIEEAGGVGIGAGRTSEAQPTREEMADILAGIEAEQMRPAQEYFELQNRINQRLAERDRLYSESLIQLTPEERARLERTALFDINDIHGIQEMTNKEFRAFAQERGVYIGAPEGATGTPEMTKIDFLQDWIEDIDLKLMDRQLPIARRQELIAKQTELRTTIATEQKIATDANIARAMENVNIAMETRISSGRIPKTVTPETPTANNPANDRITAAQPTRETEMTSLGAHEQRLQTALDAMVEVKTRGPSTMEKFRAEMQKATTRKPAQPKVQVEPTAKPSPLSAAGKAAVERARTASALTSETEMRPLVERPIAAEVPKLPPPPPVDERSAPERPTPTAPIEVEPEPPPRSAPVERPPPEPFEVSGMRTPPEEEVTLTPAQVERPVAVATETSVDRFNKIFDRMVEGHIQAGYEVPEAPPGLHGIEKQKHIMDEIIRQTVAADELITREVKGEQVIVSPEEAFAAVEKVYGKALNDPRTQRPVEAIAPEEHIGTAVPKGKKGKGRLTRKTDIKATGEQRPMQTALTGEASRARLRPTEARATAAAPEARAAAPEATMRSAPAEVMSTRSVLAPEVSSRVPILTAPEPAGPRVRAQVKSINTSGKPITPPTEPGPSPPPSAPGSGTATPQEGATVERTPAEQMSLGEEVSAGLTKKPGRQKARITNGKTKTTVNPLERFVSAQFRNAPNVEIHPGSKTLMGSLSELGARVPRLVPTRQVLLNAGHTAVAEGGGLVAGFYAGSAAGQAMSKYFATHPPKDRGDEFGQALATSMVALGVGNIVSKVVTYVIKQGVRVAMGASITGSISSAGSAGASAILEAAVFASVATTTQFLTTKAMEDAGYDHATSRGIGSFAASEALMGLEFVSFMAKGGPLNPLAFGSFVASELFLLGFGIWSYFEETEEGRLQDIAEAEQREEIEAERVAAQEARVTAIANINRTNSLRAAFMIGLETHDYDFDAMYDTLTDEQKIAMGISTPEAKAGFQRQVESAFDPLGVFAEPTTGVVAPEVLSPIEQQRRDVFNSYINYVIADLRGENPPPFNFDDPKVRELNEYSGGTWQSAAQVTATTNHMQAERVHPLILNAQNEIIDAFHNERKTIEDMPDDVVAYANLDSNFRANYEAYIIADAAAQILIEFNNTQHTYNDMDPALLAIADRDPSFRAAANAYYQTLANQARDYNLPISKIVELNALMENEQAVEVGKLNDARNAIIQKNMAENQAAIDAYNANIIKSINIYGDNFEAIIRNINEQSLLSGHTFLYASNKADLYRQLHLEMPELELIDPDDEIKDNALWKPGKGRKVGDTAIYGFRHKLTDEQNQELEDMIASGEISRQDEVYQAALIRERDRYLYVQTDQERADDLGMSLTDYHAKYGITIDIYDMEIVDYTLDTTLPENGRIRMPDGSIRTYRDGELVNIQSAPLPIVVAYDPALAQQPDGDITMPDGSVRTYKNGLVTEVLYSGLTPVGERLSPDQINAQIDATRGPTYAQLKILYPQQYQTLLLKYAGDPDADAKIEATLARGHVTGYQPHTPNINPDGTIDPETPVDPTQPVTPPQPVSTVLFNGEREMPDGTTRSYKNGKVTSIKYPAGFPVSQMITDLKTLNKNEGNYYEPTPVTPVTPTTPTEPLKNGIVNMPDGSIRTYKNGLVVYVDYPGTISTIIQKSPKQINDEEGVRNATYTGRETPETPVTPVAPTAPLQQGLVKMPDGSKRMYIDGKVVSVAYPDGVKGPTINEINATEGIKKAEPDSNNPVNPVAPVDPGGLPSQIQTPTQPDREPTYEELQVMYSANYQQYTRSYANEYKYTTTLTSPEEQAMMIEGLLRAEHANRTQAGTAPPLPPTTTTPTPTTNQPLPMVPGARSYEYADSGTQPTQTTTTPTTTTPSGGGPSDYRPRQAEPMPITATTTPSGTGPSEYRPRQQEPMQNNNP
jgi:hypothetical protein